MRPRNVMLFTAAALISATALTTTVASAQYYRGDHEPYYRGERLHGPYVYRGERFRGPGYAYRGDRFREGRDYRYRGDRY
jgi:hypothetical protein